MPTTRKANKRHPKANPPGHTILLVFFILVLCCLSLPNIISTIDNEATLEACVTPLFPHLMSRAILGWIRLLFGIFAMCVTLVVMTEKQVLKINYLKGSKLRRTPITIQGIKSQAFFTSWSWNILGFYFLFSGILTLYIDNQLSTKSSNSSNTYYDELSNDKHMKIAFRIALILFEIAAPVSMLVSVVVRYALWPKALKGNGSDNLKKITILIQHNANVIMSLIEVGLLGGLKVRFADMALAPLFGVIYVVFAWSMKHNWLKNGQPQFLYFFLDTTLGKGTSIALLVLLFLLTVFYATFALIDDIIATLGGSFWVHLGVVIGIASVTCRFKD